MRQFAVDEGFANLRFEAAARGIALFGDMPLYPAFDSADVWAHQDVFLLDDEPTTALCRGSAAGLFLGRQDNSGATRCTTGNAWHRLGSPGGSNG